MRLASSLIVAIAIVAAGCSTDGDGSLTDPGRLVLWTDDSIRALDDGEPTDLEVSGAVGQVTAGADGTLVWTRIEADPPAVAAVIDATSRITVDTPTVPFFYEWSPTGDRVALLGNAASGAGLLVGLIEVETAELTTLETPPPFFFDWSPDGTSLIAHVGGTALRLIDAGSGEIEDLPVQTGAFPAPIWTDRGIVVAIEVGPTVSGSIVPVGLQSAASEIVLIDPQDASRTTLAGVEGPVRIFASQDALALAVGTSGTQRIEVIGWDGEQRSTLGQGSIDLVQWSPDGSSLLWTERDANGPLVPKTWSDGETAEYPSFLPSPEFANAYLPFWDQYDRTISMWSLDSTAFVLPTDEGVVVHELTGDSTTYADWHMGIWTAHDSEG